MGLIFAVGGQTGIDLCRLRLYKSSWYLYPLFNRLKIFRQAVRSKRMPAGPFRQSTGLISGIPRLTT